MSELKNILLKPHRVEVSGELLDMLAKAKYNEALSIGYDTCKKSQKNKIKTLEARIAELEESYEGCNLYRQEIEKENKQLHDEIDTCTDCKTITKLREALEFLLSVSSDFAFYARGENPTAKVIRFDDYIRTALHECFGESDEN